MARKPVTDVSAWPSLALEGNLIAPAMVASIDRRQASEQTEDDYRIRKGLTIREEISTAFRVGQSHFDTFAKLENPSVEATRRFVRSFLAETFGFDDLAPAYGVVSFLAGGRVPIVVVPPSDEKLDRRSTTLSTDRSRSPAFALQDYLNESDSALWGVVTNGAVIRLMRDNASLTRPAYVEADLAQIFMNEDAASFAVLWSLLHRTRFGVAGTPASDCTLERWREAGGREGETARERLAVQVETALKVLGSGFLESNPDLAARLKSGEINLTEWFNELLRLVYRLIFLMVAEDRNLLHPEVAKPGARRLYAEGYSLAALRAQCVRAATWDKHHDRYEGIKVVFRALAHGQEALGVPALGGLFGAGMLPHLDAVRLRNRSFMEALYRLSWLSDKAGIVPVNWRAMETEELGSVYESLLELQPQLGEDGKTLAFASEVAEQKGNQRKTTGSFYTPDSLVRTLLNTALDPVLDKTEAEAADPAEALLKLSVIDPACGSGHFLLAAARRIATRLARIRAEGTPSLADFRHALRDVARCCIHGVDRNPMAVELTKVALWIETVDPGLPLGFFDAQIRCGDSLLGVYDLKLLEKGIPEEAYKPLTGDDKEVARHYAQKNKRERAEKDRIAKGFGFDRARDLMRDFEALRAMPENTVDEIDAKAARLHALTAQGASAWQLEAACDLYVSAFLLPKTKSGPHAGPDGMPRRGAETVPSSGVVWEWLRGVQPFGPMFGAAMDMARKARAFHWPLEFPDVMQRGGFDVVLGNPPWEVIQFSDEEFFSGPAPQIASLPGAKRKKAIAEIEATDQALWESYRTSLRRVEGTKEFVKSSERFSLTAFGKLNMYALFAELAMKLANDAGRSGVIVQSGIATDDGNKHFFEHLISNNLLVCLYDFENREKLFPIDSRMKFAILALGKNIPQADFVFFATNTNHVDDHERRFRLSAEDIKLINPNTKTCPVFRSNTDAELTKSIYTRSGSFVNEISGTKDKWRVELIRILNLTDDSHLFKTQQELIDLGAEPRDNTWFTREGTNYLPLYEPKMIHHYDHRWASYDTQNEAFSDVSEADHKSPDFFAQPRWWVESRHIDEWLAGRNWTAKWLFGWRDTTNATNERTTIATAFPVCAVGNNLPLIILNKSHRSTDYAALIANMSSIPFDYAARQKVGGTHLNYFLVEQLPVLPPSSYSQADFDFIVPRVVELRSRIFARLPNGLMAAELLIDGVCWVAVRPLGLPGGEFVVQVASIEDAIARGRRDGDQAFIDPLVIEAFFPMIAGATPPDVSREQVWDVLRAWLTRDQECRLADILAWRSPQTQSRSRAQVLGETAKLTMVRLALRALDAEEQTAALRERELVTAAEDERRRQAYQQQRYLDGLKVVRAALSAGEEVGFDDTIDQKGLVSLAEAALAQAMRADLPKPPDVGSIFARLNALNEERRALEASQQGSLKEADLKRGEAERYRAEANLGEIDITQGGVRVCPICRVSVDETLAKGCGISLERCDLAALKATITDKLAKAAQFAAEADNAAQEAKRFEALVNQLGPRQQALEAEVRSADADSRAAQAAAKDIQDRIYRARRILDDVRSLREAETAAKPAPPATAALDAVRAQLEAGRSRARAAIRTLEERYQGIMAAWLPDEVEGTVKLDGNGLKVDAQFAGRGEVSTAALDSLKIVAFDLAALHMAVEEKADSPAFLVHDSPREADLDGQLYERLFGLLHQWEESVETPCFQYIVTTTTAPPLELQTDRHVRLQMSSTPAAMRLFGMDL